MPFATLSSSPRDRPRLTHSGYVIKTIRCALLTCCLLPQRIWLLAIESLVSVLDDFSTVAACRNTTSATPRSSIDLIRQQFSSRSALRAVAAHISTMPNFAYLIPSNPTSITSGQKNTASAGTGTAVSVGTATVIGSSITPGLGSVSNGPLSATE